MAYLVIILLGALGCWWDYRTLYPKPKKYIDCATGCGAQLLRGMHFNSNVEGHELPNGLVCRKCYPKIMDEVDEALGILPVAREEECIQATPETRKMVAAMTKKWPVDHDEAQLAAGRAAAVAREEGYEYTPPQTRCSWCNGESLGGLCNACILWGTTGLDKRILENRPRMERGTLNGDLPGNMPDEQLREFFQTNPQVKKAVSGTL